MSSLPQQMKEELLAGMEKEKRAREFADPKFEKLLAQFERGLLTVAEFASEVALVMVEAYAHADNTNHKEHNAW